MKPILWVTSRVWTIRLILRILNCVRHELVERHKKYGEDWNMMNNLNSSRCVGPCLPLTKRKCTFFQAHKEHLPKT